MKAQRLRVTFGRGEPLRFVSHLDLMRFWERAMRRAGIAVDYSEGFSPHPRIALGAPLPVGTTGAAELMDVVLSESLPPEEFVTRVRPQLPDGVTISDAREVPLNLASLQSQLRAADYRVTLTEGASAEQATAAVARFLDLESLPWEQQREKEVKRYDLRPLVLTLAAQREDGATMLTMRLDAGPGSTGRPDQVVAALGFPPPAQVHRVALLLEEDAAATVDP